MRLLLAVLIMGVFAHASGAPCWDDVPPARKYSAHHVVQGNAPHAPGQTLFADGINVSANLTDNGSDIMVELTVTNCSAATIDAVPEAYDLAVLGPGGPQNDIRLRHLDPTIFRRIGNRTYPPLRAETLPYGRVGTYFLFFSPDTYFTNMDHRVMLPVTLGRWQFMFYFEKKRSA